MNVHFCSLLNIPEYRRTLIKGALESVLFAGRERTEQLPREIQINERIFKCVNCFPPRTWPVFAEDKY